MKSYLFLVLNTLSYVFSLCYILRLNELILSHWEIWWPLTYYGWSFYCIIYLFLFVFLLNKFLNLSINFLKPLYFFFINWHYWRISIAIYRTRMRTISPIITQPIISLYYSVKYRISSSTAYRMMQSSHKKSIISH